MSYGKYCGASDKKTMKLQEQLYNALVESEASGNCYW